MSLGSRSLSLAMTVASVTLCPGLARADEPAPAPADVKGLDSSTDASAVVGETVEAPSAPASAVAPVPPPAAAPPAAPYVLPWRLRPAAAFTAFRVDTVAASYRGPAPGRL